MASWIKLLVIMHADKISAKKETTFLDKAWVLTWASCFGNSQKGHLITDHQKTYPKSNFKMDTKNHRKSYFNLTMGQFLFLKYQIIKGLHWMTCVGSLTKEAWFSKILSKIDISLISFQ
jgi:hypothetical protein